MVSRRLGVFALLMIPVVASAQRGAAGRGTKPPDYDQLSAKDRSPGGMKLTNKDVESMSPVRMLIDKRKDLALSDDQLKAFKDLDAKSKPRNDTLFKALDSLRRELKPSTAPPDVERLRVRSLMPSVIAVVQEIRANYDADAGAALPLLVDSQKKTAGELLAKLKQESDETLQQKLGGRRQG